MSRDTTVKPCSLKSFARTADSASICGCNGYEDGGKTQTAPIGEAEGKAGVSVVKHCQQQILVGFCKGLCTTDG